MKLASVMYFGSGREDIPPDPADRMPENFRKFSIMPPVWVELCPPPKYMWSPSVWYLWVWSHLEIESLQCNTVKLRSLWVKVGPKSNERCPLKKRKFWRQRHRDTQGRQKENNHVMIEAVTGVMWLKPRIAGNHQKLEKGKEGLSLELSEEIWSSDTLISDFWSLELRITDYYFKAPSLW